LTTVTVSAPPDGLEEAVNRKTVGIVVFPDVEVLDFCGPFEVFSVTRLNEERRREEPSPFEVFLVAERSGPIVATGGLRVLPDVRGHLGGHRHGPSRRHALFRRAGGARDRAAHGIPVPGRQSPTRDDRAGDVSGATTVRPVPLAPTFSTTRPAARGPFGGHARMR